MFFAIDVVERNLRLGNYLSIVMSYEDNVNLGLVITTVKGDCEVRALSEIFVHYDEIVRVGIFEITLAIVVPCLIPKATMRSVSIHSTSYFAVSSSNSIQGRQF